MSNLIPNPSEQPVDRRLAASRAVLVAGGGFATTVATILGAVGKWHLGERATLWALGALCVIVALTLFLVAYLMARVSHLRGGCGAGQSVVT